MKVLVTGGGGFLGSAIVARLRARGDRVTSFSRACYPHLEALGCHQIQGDLCEREAVLRAVAGQDAVVHVAALAGVWGPESAYFRANVLGTRHVLEACRAAAVERLVYTSSPSVVFDGTDQAGCDESVPYPAHFLAAYPRTKAQAEREVLAANAVGLATVALRPHLIWGPGDNHLVPRILERGRHGRLRLIGAEDKLVDSVYVDNAADAHLLAIDKLTPGSPCAGKAYFITNGEPMTMRALLDGILAAGGLPPVRRRVPAWLAYGVGAVLEACYGLTGCRNEPPLTRFVARQLATAHYYSIEAARRDLGYVPEVSVAEGLIRLAQTLQGQHPCC